MRPPFFGVGGHTRFPAQPPSLFSQPFPAPQARIILASVLLRTLPSKKCSWSAQLQRLPPALARMLPKLGSLIIDSSAAVPAYVHTFRASHQAAMRAAKTVRRPPRPSLRLLRPPCWAPGRPLAADRGMERRSRDRQESPGKAAGEGRAGPGMPTMGRDRLAQRAAGGLCSLGALISTILPPPAAPGGGLTGSPAPHRRGLRPRTPALSRTGRPPAPTL